MVCLIASENDTGLTHIRNFYAHVGLTGAKIYRTGTEVIIGTDAFFN